MTMCHPKNPRRLWLGMAILMLFGAIERPVSIVHAQGAEPTTSLTIDFAGSGTGKVVASPGPTSPQLICFRDCTDAYDLLQPPTTVTLIATPTGLGTAASSFGGWSGSGCTGTGSCVVSMSAARSVTATFTAAPVTHTLTVTKNGTGSGTVTSSPGGITCGSDCSQPYTAGTSVTLTAGASGGSSFGGWSGSGCTGTGSCVVSMSAARSVTATFTAAPVTHTLTVTKNGTGSGTVTSSPGGITCGSDCSQPYTAGTSVTLTAGASGGSSFEGWSGSGCTGTGSCVVSMSAARSVTATFDVELASSSSNVVHDLNNDARADILWRHTNGDVAVWLMDGLTLDETGIIAAVGDAAWGIEGVGDVNGDGMGDIVWQHTNGEVAVWLMDGLNAPTATSVIASGVPLVWEVKEVGDLDGDGNVDLIWRNTSDGAVAGWLMNGLTVSSIGIPSGATLDWTLVGSGDLDGDEKTDLVWRSTAGGVAVWLMDGVNAPTATSVIASGVPLVWAIQ